MKKLSISTLFLTLVGSIYLFVSLVFGIITGADADFWTGFGFLTFGAIVAVVILLLFGNKQTTIKDVFFNAPIYYIGAVYFAVSGNNITFTLEFRHHSGGVRKDLTVKGVIEIINKFPHLYLYYNGFLWEFESKNI